MDESSQPRSTPQPPPPDPLAQVQRERSVLLRLVRLGFLILMVTVAMLLVLQQGDSVSDSPISPPTHRPIAGSALSSAGERDHVGPTAPDRDGAATSAATGDAHVLTFDPKTMSILTQIRDRLSESSAGAGRPGFAVAVNWYSILGAAVVFFAIVVLVDMLTPNKRIAAVSGVFLGTLTGILATLALSFVIDLVVRTWIPNERGLEAIRPILAAIKVMLGISLCYLAVSTVMQTQDQFRLVIPYVEFTKQLRGARPYLLDTSALIDARITEIAATGLIQAALIVPRFVVAELQLLADSGDRLERRRGRRGLDVVTRLQRLGTMEVVIDETPVQAIGVDQMLVELAEKLGARIITTDLGLARVAQIKGLMAINLHDLANSLRPALVPGEQISIRLVKTGEQPGQAVGYLDDGTMVVAEGGAPHIGDEVVLLVTSTMQTTAGRLVFARPATSGADADEPIAGKPELDAAPSLPPEAAGASAPALEEIAMPEKLVPARPGPFPPKPAMRRGSGPASPRNPRR